MPFAEGHSVSHPVSLYAASKAANELMAHTYSHLYDLSATGLRFFTVYGPWGRPDMAPMLFARAILAGEPIRVFNYGRMRRDFTYIDDIVEAVIGCLDRPASADPHFDPAAPDPATRAGPPIDCSISAIPSQPSCCTSFGCWSRRWASQQSWSCCRSSPVTWRPRLPIPVAWNRGWVFGPAPQLSWDCSDLLSGCCS